MADEWLNRWRDGWKDGWLDVWTERDGTAFRPVDELMDLWVYGWINSFIVG